MAAKKKKPTKAKHPKAKRPKAKRSKSKRASAPRAATVGGLPQAPKLEPTAAAYGREVKRIARATLALRREHKGDRAFALDAVAERANTHPWTAKRHKALAILMWSGHADAWPSSGRDMEAGILSLAEAALAADVWDRVDPKLPAKMRAEAIAAAPRAAGGRTPKLRPGYVFVNDDGRYDDPREVPPDEWSEYPLGQREVDGARFVGEITLYGDRLRAFKLSDGRCAAATLASTNA